MGRIIAKRPQHDFHPSPASEGGPSEREGAIPGAQDAAVQSRGCHLVGMCMGWTSLAWPDSRRSPTPLSMVWLRETLDTSAVDFGVH